MSKPLLVILFVFGLLVGCSGSKGTTGTTTSGAPFQPTGGTDPYNYNNNQYYYDSATNDPYSQYTTTSAGQVWVALGQSSPGSWNWLGDITAPGDPNSICSRSPYSINPYAPNPSALWLYDEASGQLTQFGCWLVKSAATGGCDPEVLVRSLCGF